MKTVFVDNQSFSRLFEDGASVRIPDYQRPYTWSKRTAAALLDDLKVAFTGPAPEKEYYLGSVVFYKNRTTKTYEIIDGQQRITTLLILKYLLDGPLPEGLNLPLGSHQSVNNIIAIRDFLADKLEEFRKPGFDNLLSRLTFTRVVTLTEDAAFTFFDTQNNRGVKLSVTDFLKAYHLREIRSAQSPAQAELLQSAYAQTWEQADTSAMGGALLANLFEKILWRSRNWKGQKSIGFETKDLILQTFQQGAVSTNTSPTASRIVGSLNRYAHPEECPPTHLLHRQRRRYYRTRWRRLACVSLSTREAIFSSTRESTPNYLRFYSPGREEERPFNKCGRSTRKCITTTCQCTCASSCSCAC